MAVSTSACHTLKACLHPPSLLYQWTSGMDQYQWHGGCSLFLRRITSSPTYFFLGESISADTHEGISDQCAKTAEILDCVHVCNYRVEGLAEK